MGWRRNLGSCPAAPHASSIKLTVCSDHSRPSSRSDGCDVQRSQPIFWIDECRFRSYLPRVFPAGGVASRADFCLRSEATSETATVVAWADCACASASACEFAHVHPCGSASSAAHGEMVDLRTSRSAERGWILVSASTSTGDGGRHGQVRGDGERGLSGGGGVSGALPIMGYAMGRLRWAELFGAVEVRWVWEGRWVQ